MSKNSIGKEFRSIRHCHIYIAEIRQQLFAPSIEDIKRHISLLSMVLKNMI